MKRGVWVVAASLCVVGAVALGQSARRGRGGSDVAISKVDVTAQAKQLDALVLKAAEAKGLKPTPVVDDLAFLRRASLDLIGRVPTYEEIERYRADKPAERRGKLVKRLINSGGFVDRMAIFFGDMMNVRSREDEGRGLESYIKRSLAANKPYDVMVREILTANGSARGNQAVGFFISEGADPFQMAAKTSHVFMGTRIHCAQCHNHPFDEWKRQQFYSLAAYFGKTKLYFPEDDALAPSVTETKKNVVTWPPKGKDAKPLDPSWPFMKEDKDAAHLQAVIARRAKLQEMRAADAMLGEKAEAGIDAAPELAGANSAKGEMSKAAASIKLAPTRDALAELLTSVQNKLFAQSMANRLWAEFVGRGIVNPVDDFRADNVPSNPELLTYLGDEFIASNYDLRAMVEMIVLSETYARSRSVTSDKGQREVLEQAFVAAPLRRMIAEQMYDSLVTAGHLRTPKYRADENLREVTETVLVARPKEMKPVPKPAPTTAAATAQKPVNETESSEVELEDLLSNPEEKPMLAGKEMLNQATAEEPMRVRREYVYEYKKVTKVYDFNPTFGPAARIAAPAPSEHFLRQFGQSGRTLLGVKRDSMPTMRQGLILLNGSLANEAARVGTLEPMWGLLDAKAVDGAVKRAYMEIFTREPSAEEMQGAKTLIEGAPTRAEGMADLRWAMLNSNEFRYLP